MHDWPDSRDLKVQAKADLARAEALVTKLSETQPASSLLLEGTKEAKQEKTLETTHRMSMAESVKAVTTVGNAALDEANGRLEAEREAALASLADALNAVVAQKLADAGVVLPEDKSAAIITHCGSGGATCTWACI